MLANVNELASSFIAALVFDVQKAPFLGRTSVIGAGKQPTAAEFCRRWRTFPLPPQSFKKIVKQPIRNGISLARIDPTKHEQMTKQYLPMWVHVHDQALPFDCLSLLKNEMDDIDAIMTVSLLDERLGPDQLGRVDHRHAMPEHLRLTAYALSASSNPQGTPLDQKGSFGDRIGGGVLLVEPPDSAQAIVDPRDAAESAGLRYVSDERPGIRRKKAGTGYSYTRSDGSRLLEPDALKRIRALAIPHAWTDVWICPFPDGHIQATGRDAKDRKQYRYHARFREVRESTKYEHVVAFADALPSIRETVREHIYFQSAEHIECDDPAGQRYVQISETQPAIPTLTSILTRGKAP
jgi:hypothetical protein